MFLLFGSFSATPAGAITHLAECQRTAIVVRLKSTAVKPARQLHGRLCVHHIPRHGVGHLLDLVVVDVVAGVNAADREAAGQLAEQFEIAQRTGGPSAGSWTSFCPAVGWRVLGRWSCRAISTRISTDWISRDSFFRTLCATTSGSEKIEDCSLCPEWSGQGHPPSRRACLVSDFLGSTQPVRRRSTAQLPLE